MPLATVLWEAAQPSSVEQRKEQDASGHEKCSPHEEGVGRYGERRLQSLVCPMLSCSVAQGTFSVPTL